MSAAESGDAAGAFDLAAFVAALDAAGLAAAADISPPAEWGCELPRSAAPRRRVRAACRHRFERDGLGLVCVGCGADRADLDAPAAPPVTPPLRVTGERGALLTRNMFGSAPEAHDRALRSVLSELDRDNEQLRRAHGRHFRGDVLQAAAALYADLVSPRVTLRRGPRADVLAACIRRAANGAGALYDPADLPRLLGDGVNVETGETTLRGLAGETGGGLDAQYAAAVRAYAEARAPAARLEPVAAEAARIAAVADRLEIGGASVAVRAAGAVLLALHAPDAPSRADAAAFAAGLPGGVRPAALLKFAAEFQKYGRE